MRPPTIGPDMVLIESVGTSVNPIDWKIRSGARQKDFPLDLPAILGKDVSGIVRAVGSDIRNFKPGGPCDRNGRSDVCSIRDYTGCIGDPSARRDGFD
jgi:NADPH:quinone reductase-like Zn-dependent oxidoreductase